MKTFRLPDLGEGLEEAEIVTWHVNEGDRVVVDQPLVSVETDKAVVEVEAQQDGVLGRIVIPMELRRTLGISVKDPMSIWVEDVDEVHRRCLEQGLEVTWPPTDEPWGVREMHVRHPDGHVFRISRGMGQE